MNVEIATLKNGFTYGHIYQNSPATFVQASVNVGGLDDPIPGTSHALEHMLFNGTANKRSAFEIGRVADYMGGEWNAFTNNRLTAIHRKVPNIHAQATVDLFFELLSQSTCETASTRQELGHIREEDIGYERDPQNELYHRIANDIFGYGKDRWSTIGSPSSLRKINRKILLQHQEQFYVSANMALFTVGPQKVDASIFENIRLGKRLQRKKKVPNEKYAYRLSTDQQEHLIWAVPSAYFDNVAAIAHEVVFTMLVNNNNATAFVYDEFRNKPGLSCYTVSGYHESDPSSPIIGAYVATSKGSRRIAIDKMNNVLERLQSATADQIALAIDTLKNNYIVEGTDEEQQIEEIASEVFMGDLPYASLLEKISVEEVQRIIPKYAFEINPKR